MEPAAIETVFRRGATWRRHFILALPGATEANGFTPRRNLSGAEARMDVRLKVGAPLLLSISEVAGVNGGITLGGADGTMVLWLSPAATLLLPQKSVKVYWDVFLEWPGSPKDVDKALAGTAKVDPNVTEPTYD